MSDFLESKRFRRLFSRHHVCMLVSTSPYSALYSNHTCLQHKSDYSLDAADKTARAFYQDIKFERLVIVKYTINSWFWNHLLIVQASGLHFKDLEMTGRWLSATPVPSITTRKPLLQIESITTDSPRTSDTTTAPNTNGIVSRTWLGTKSSCSDRQTRAWMGVE